LSTVRNFRELRTVTDRSSTLKDCIHGGCVADWWGFTWMILAEARGVLTPEKRAAAWCSYCQRDLLGVEEMLPDIRKANASVIAITHGLSSRVLATLGQTVNISFPVVDDADGVIAEQFGLRWSVSDANLIDAETGRT
jgi:hypothetical protein